MMKSLMKMKKLSKPKKKRKTLNPVNQKMKMRVFKSERLTLRTENLFKMMSKKTMKRVKKTMETLKLKKWRQVMSSWPSSHGSEL